MNGKKSHNLRVFTNFLAFLILILITMVLVIAKIFGASNISGIMIEISRIVAYLLVSLASMWYVFSKRNIWIKVVWFICVVAIFVVFII